MTATKGDGEPPDSWVVALEGLPGVLAGVCDDGPLPDLPREELTALLKGRLRVVMASENRVSLAIGAGLRRMQTDLPHAPLGQASFDALCAQRYGFSGAHGRELVAAWKEGARLPLIVGAFLAGELSSSKVRELVRVATPETEAGLVRLARGVSVRELRRLVRSLAAGEAVAEMAVEEEDLRERVRMEAMAADAATIRGPGLQMVRTVAGIAGPEHELFHCLAMEASSEVEVLEQVAPRPARVARVPKRARRLRLEAVRRLARKSRAAREVEPLVELPDVGTARTLNELHAMMLQLVAVRAMARWERTCLLGVIVGHRLHGHASLGAYAEELGLPPREVSVGDALCLRATPLPRLRDALRRGLISAPAAWMLLRVVVPQNEEEWLRRARVLSLKRLEAEVLWTWRRRVGLSDAEYLRFNEGALPPERLSMSRLVDDWMVPFGVERVRGRKQRGGACALDGGDPVREAAEAGADVTAEGVCASERGELAQSGQGEGVCASERPDSARGAAEGEMAEGVRASEQPDSARASDADHADDVDEDDPVLPAALRRVVFGFSAPPEVARYFHSVLMGVRRNFGYSIDDGEAVLLMMLHFLEHEVSQAERQRFARDAILRRDRFCCTFPGCSNMRHLEIHHLHERSLGGSDDPWNLATLCDRHHHMYHDRLIVIQRGPRGPVFYVGVQDGVALERWEDDVLTGTNVPVPPRPVVRRRRRA